MILNYCTTARQSHKQRADAEWRMEKQEKCQGNVCQGNNPENAFFHSPDNHSPDFALCHPELRNGTTGSNAPKARADEEF
jgi:hypothetical protein